jgi:hypothetical protein
LATANFSTKRTIHESQSFEIVPVPAQRTTGKEGTGILAFFATLPRGQRRAKFTDAAARRLKGKVRLQWTIFLPLIFFL